jgi:hypothetical protein
MLSFRPKSLRRTGAAFGVRLGSTAQVGTYTVYGTVEAGTIAFGTSTTFAVTAN